MSVVAFPSPHQADTLGERIASARGLRRWGQSELLAAIEHRWPGESPSRRTLSSWENDRTSPSVADLQRVALVTKLPWSWFVDDIDLTDPDGVGTLGEPPTKWYGSRPAPRLATVLDLTDRLPA